MTRRPKLTVETIAAGLHPLIVPIDWIEELPGNPRRGRVEAIRRSVQAFGLRKPVVVRRTGEVDGHPIGYATSGNHTLKALREMGWEYVAALWVDESEEEAYAWSLADNRSHDLGAYDPDDIAAVIARLGARTDLLDATGYDADAITRIAAATTAGTLGPAGNSGGGDGGGLEPGPRGLGTPVISTTIVFDDEEQQQSWYAFVRMLREEYGDAETLAERLHLYIAERVLADA